MGGETTEMSDDDDARSWSRPRTGTPVSMFRTGKRHKLTSEAGKRNERGVDPTICEAAADRVVELLTTYGGGTAEPGRHRGRQRRRRRGRSRSPRDLPGQVAGLDDRRRPRRSRASRAVGCDVGRRRHADGHPAAVAPRPHRPLRPGRGGRPDRRLRPGAVGAADRRRPAAGSPASSGCAAGSAAPWPAPGCVEVVSFPFVGDATFDALGLPGRRRAAARRTPVQPALGREAARTRPRCCPALLDAAARNLGRGAPGRRALRDRHGRVPGRPRAGAGLRRRLAAQRGRAGQAVRGPARCSRCSWPVVLAASASPPGWWGAGRTADWSDAIEAGPRGWPTSWASRSRSSPAERMPWHPSRCAAGAGRRRGARPRRRAAPAGLRRRSGCRRARPPLEIDLDFLMRARGRRAAGAGVLRPTRWPRRTSRSSSPTT